MTDRELVLVLFWLVAAASLFVRPDEQLIRRLCPEGHVAVLDEVRLAGPLAWAPGHNGYVVKVRP